MKRYSIAGMLPVNILVDANSETEAIEIAREASLLEYDSAGDIEIEENPSIYCLDKEE